MCEIPEPNLLDASLRQALKLLPAKERNILRRFSVGNGGQRIRNHKQIAKELGLTEGALRARVMRYRRKLAALIDRIQTRTV